MDEKRKTDWTQLLVGIGTLLLAAATVLMVYQNYQNIRLTEATVKQNQDDAFMRWRPELFIEQTPMPISAEEKKEQEKQEKLIMEGKAKTLGIQMSFTWGNAGGSPALNIYRVPIVNRSKNPIADTMTFTPTVTFSIWPTQKFVEDITFDFTNHSPKDDMYAHIPAFYQDRKGNRYWTETVFYCRFENNKLIRFGNDGVYEGTIEK